MRIKNWEKFQHFKDRRPPWIKLYRDLLDDDEWFTLPHASARTLVLLWLIASEDETKQGTLPSIKKLAFRCRITESSMKSIISDLSHWLIQDDIKPISEGYQLGPSETERETYTKERETETNGVTVNVFEYFWNAYPKKIGKKEALRAWEKAKDKPLLDDILQAIERAKQSEQWMKDNGQFIPNPSTWLNQGRWDDEATTKPLSTMEAFLSRKETTDDPRRLC